MSKNEYYIDAKLVISYQSGNTVALTQLVKRWHKAFCNKAYWIIKDKQVAKDIAQDSWKTIIEKIDDLKDPNTFASWSLRIVCNKSFDWLRRHKKVTENLNGLELNDDVEELQYDDEREQQRKVLLKAIKVLPLHQKEVIKLFYTEAYSLKEISKTLNISVGTTKSRLFHAREKLKQILKNRNYEK